jgi:glycosyltransferase involved in cell wall biosynthesis
MRIIVLTNCDQWGGTEINTLGVIDALSACGHEVTLLQIGHDTYDRWGPGSTNGHRSVSVSMAPYHNFNSLPFGWWRRLLREWAPDVCVLSKGWFEMRSPGLDLAARLGLRRFVVIEHHPAEPMLPRTTWRRLGGRMRKPDPQWWRWWRHYLGTRLHTAAPHRVISDSRFTADVLHTHYSLARGKTFVIHPGVDPRAFTFRSGARAELRAQWGIPGDALVLGSVGRLEPVKGLDRSVRAFAEVTREYPGSPAWLLLAGNGAERERLMTLAGELGVADRVVFPGYVEHAADALAVLDCYLMPSREEGFGIALIEAMACERVCVAMDSGGPRDILTDPSLGWITPADDQAAFTEAVCAAVSLDADARRAMGRAARAHVEQHFDRGRQTRRIADLIVTA